MTPSGKNDGLILGVDIGGTKIALGLVDRAGKIITEARHPMMAHGTAEEGLKAVTDAIDSMTAPAAAYGGFHSIGVCAPGPLDPRTGNILNPPNLPCWRNFPLAERLRKIYSQPVKVDNDANAAALAETIWGASRGYHYVFYGTIGTGIGSGIVLDGKIYYGKTGSAGEGGHVVIDYHGPVCTCGKRGCIEILAAGPAIAVRARAKLTRGVHSRVLDLAQGNVAAVTSEMVGKAYTEGDSLARETLQETVELLVIWLGNIVDLLDPDILVLGGGVTTMLSPFLDEMKKRLPTWAENPHAADIPLVMARYGADAGIAGGAALFAD
jgi:glucokinase